MQQEIQDFIDLCTKITQAYRLRLALHSIRYKLLKSVNNKFESMGRKVISQLIINLSRERKILEIIKRRDVFFQTNIQYALELLTQYQLKIKGSNRGRVYLDNKKFFKIADMHRFIGGLIQFIETIKKDLYDIEYRLRIQEDFCLKPIKKNFNKFILAWNEEQRINIAYVREYLKILRKNSKMLKVIRYDFDEQLRIFRVHELHWEMPVLDASPILLNLPLYIVAYSMASILDFLINARDRLVDMGTEQTIIAEIDESLRPAIV
ncbi:MAG: hypothetical protein ABIJ08_03710 [Nanoarchaeota archaeon]